MRYLAHHGVKGQKWGVRRYQNEDGSLTSEGRKRYLKSDGSLTRRGKKEFSKLEREYFDESKESDRASKRGAMYKKLTNDSDKVDALDLENMAVKEQEKLINYGKVFSDDYFAAYDLQMTAIYYHQNIGQNGKDFVTKQFASLTDSDQRAKAELRELERLEKADAEDSGTYNWKNPDKTVKYLYDNGYSVGEIAADLPFELTKQGKEEAYVRKVLGK